jgi:hypothetical protein
MAPSIADTENPRAALPTYATIADVLEKKNGSGLRLVGWTLARTILIMPGMLAVGISPKRAFAGSLISSSLISVLTLVRVYNAGFEQEAERWAKVRQERKLLGWEEKWSKRKDRALAAAKMRQDRGLKRAFRLRGANQKWK